MGAPNEDQQLVFIPRQPGPLVQMPTPERSADDVDDVLDELFGPDDDRGPTITDAVLVVGGLALITAALTTDLSDSLALVGAALVALGAILPLRAVAQRLSKRRTQQRIESGTGDAMPLRQDDPRLSAIATDYATVLEHAERMPATRRANAETVAHALIEEVATLLDGAIPEGAAETEYVDARSRSMRELADVARQMPAFDPTSERRRAVAEARMDVERAAGQSTIDESAALIDELRADRDA